MTNNKTQNKIAEPGNKVEELKTKLCLSINPFAPKLPITAHRDPRPFYRL